jgi:hypothetical protein
MKTNKAPGQKLPTHDYSPALQGALSWLGSRYLLAEPLNRRRDEPKLQFSAPARAQ